MSIVLIRHTTPDVAADICYGRTDLDVASSFAEEARIVLKSIQGADVLITSPLHRCRQLANRIGDQLDLIPRIDHRIQEFDFGQWENRPWSQIPQTELDEWANDFMHARPHGGESVAMLRKRTQAAIDEFRQTGLRHIVVTHAGVVKAAFAKGDAADDFRTDIPYGAVIPLP